MLRSIRVDHLNSENSLIIKICDSTQNMDKKSTKKKNTKPYVGCIRLLVLNKKNVWKQCAYYVYPVLHFEIK